MSNRRPALALVREGNQGHHAADRLDSGLRLPVEAPDEPDWQQWWPGRTGDRARNGEQTRARRVARSMWREVVTILDRQGLVARLDRALLQDLAVATAQLDGALRTIAADGAVVEGQKGNTVRHPLWPVVHQLRAHLRGLWADVGVGPIARDRMPLGGIEDDPDNPFD